MPWDVTASTFQGYLAAKVALHPTAHRELLDALEEGERRHKLCLLPVARMELYHLKWYARVQYRHNLYALEQRRVIYR